MDICILSGLEIPKKAYSREHYYPKSLLPHSLAYDDSNIYPAHKIMNSLKGNAVPCVWEQEKWERCWRALVKYTLTSKDKDFIQKALNYWLDYKNNPCEHCIANKYIYYCVRSR